MMKFLIFLLLLSTISVQAALPWCKDVKSLWRNPDGSVDQQKKLDGRRLKNSTFDGVIEFHCKFPGKNNVGLIKDRPSAFQDKLIEKMRTQKTMRVVDGREIEYGNKLANNFVEGPVDHAHWDYTHFFNIGLIAKTASGQEVAKDAAGNVIFKGLTLARDWLETKFITPYFFRDRGRYFLFENTSYSEDAEEMMTRQHLFLTAGEDFFASHQVTTGIYDVDNGDREPHEYLRKIETSYKIFALSEFDDQGHWVYAFKLRSHLRANYSGSHTDTFLERAMIPFDQLATTKVKDLTNFLVENF